MSKNGPHSKTVHGPFRKPAPSLGNSGPMLADPGPSLADSVAEFGTHLCGRSVVSFVSRDPKPWYGGPPGQYVARFRASVRPKSATFGGQIWPTPGRSWSTLVAAQSRPPNSADSGPHRPMLVESVPQRCAHLDRVEPISTPVSAPPRFGQTRDGINLLWGIPTGCGPRVDKSSACFPSCEALAAKGK